MMEIFRQDGLTIWYYKFTYKDDFQTAQGSLTGTKKAFEDLKQNIEQTNALIYSITKRHATKEEYECLKSFWKYARQVEKEG